MDAYFDEDMNHGTSRAILLDGRGFFIVITTQLIGQVYDGGTTEAYAILHGLILVDHMDCNRIIVNFDCMVEISTPQ